MALSDWTTIRDFAAQIYGEGRVAKVETETYSRYNDETYDNCLEAITAYDTEGNEIGPDYSLPFFQIKQWTGPKSNEDTDESGDEDDDWDDEDSDAFFEAFEGLSMPDKEKQQGNWVLFEDIEKLSGDCFDLTKPPTLTLPTQEVSL